MNNLNAYNNILYLYKHKADYVYIIYSLPNGVELVGGVEAEVVTGVVVTGVVMTGVVVDVVVDNGVVKVDMVVPTVILLKDALESDFEFKRHHSFYCTRHNSS